MRSATSRVTYSRARRMACRAALPNARADARITRVNRIATALVLGAFLRFARAPRCAFALLLRAPRAAGRAPRAARRSQASVTRSCKARHCALARLALSAHALLRAARRYILRVKATRLCARDARRARRAHTHAARIFL